MPKKKRKRNKKDITMEKVYLTQYLFIECEF